MVARTNSGGAKTGRIAQAEGLIPSGVLTSQSEGRDVGHCTHLCGMTGEMTPSCCQRLNHRAQRGASAMVAPLVPAFLPAGLHRIEGRPGGRWREEADLLRDPESSGGVPAGSIAWPDEEVVCNGRGHRSEEALPPRRRRLGPHARGHGPPRWRHGRISLHILPHHLSRGLGAHAGRGPAACGRTEAAETAFIWGPREDRARLLGRPGGPGGVEGCRKGLFPASWVSGVAAGGLARGAICRQPWRDPTRYLVVGGPVWGP
jgi:hypothetical protein